MSATATGELTGRLLVVDDQELNRDMLSRRLRRLGHEVDVAHDGISALARLREAGEYDLLLLDIMMPGMDGYAVLEELKGDENLRDLPVIMISAVTDVESVVRCIELGADDHLPKPFNPTILRARIRSCLSRKRMHDLEKEHARALELELAIGRAIQRSFLPRDMPAVPGWSIDGRLRSARQVAGDYYDVFPLAGGRLLAVIVADVCDKGVAAALFMAVSRSLFRALATQQYGGLAGDRGAEAGELVQTVSFVSDYIADVHGRTNMFATVFFCLVDPMTGQLVYVNGGHDPPIICGDGGVREVLDPTGPALGLMPGMEFSVETAELREGDSLLLYTDGVTDVRAPDGEEFGVDRLTSFAAGHSTGSPTDLLDAIERAVAEHAAGVPPFDDMTLLALRRGVS
jgi:phosphoserine phosphatase RsbU/P